MNLVRFPKSRLVEIRASCSESFYAFAKGPWGDKDYGPLQRTLCDFLQYDADFRRKLICGFRGSLKSSVVRAYMVWTGLEIVNYSWLLVEQREDNARAHLKKAQDKFTTGTQAALLQDMYEDRIPPGLEGWNTGTLAFVKTDPNADPTITIAGIESKLESMHKDGIAVDDPEGADADRSESGNSEARKLILERCTPLLKSPELGQILVALTPHGADPTAWHIRNLEARDENGTGSDDNAERRRHLAMWGIWWKQIRGLNGRSAWPQRFSDAWIDQQDRTLALSTEGRRMLDMQYYLKRSSSGASNFDLRKIAENYYDLSESGSVALYNGDEAREVDADHGHVYRFRSGRKSCSVGAMRVYLHGDPAHRDLKQVRAQGYEPSKAAWVVVGVSPDFHAFVLDTWAEFASLDKFAEAFFYLYRKWVPYQWTCETIGAQVWFLSHVKTLEQTRMQNIHSMPRPWRQDTHRLPRPSTRFVEPDDNRKGTTEKYEYIIRQLEVPHNMGWLHLHASQTELIGAHERFGVAETKKAALDILDALAQGPAVWTPPPSADAVRNVIKRNLEKAAATGTALRPTA